MCYFSTIGLKCVCVCVFFFVFTFSWMKKGDEGVQILMTHLKIDPVSIIYVFPIDFYFCFFISYNLSFLLLPTWGLENETLTTYIQANMIVRTITNVGAIISVKHDPEINNRLFAICLSFIHILQTISFLRFEIFFLICLCLHFSFTICYLSSLWFDISVWKSIFRSRWRWTRTGMKKGL